MSLRASLIRLAAENPELRPKLLPLLEKQGKAPPAGHAVPKDVYLRAGRRWLDALERKGFEGAVRATALRIKKISEGSPKAEGLAQYLKAWLKEQKGLKAAQKASVKKLIEDAEYKAHAVMASTKQADIRDPTSPWPSLTSEDKKVLREIAWKYNRAMDTVWNGLQDFKAQMEADKRRVQQMVRKTQDRVTKRHGEGMLKLYDKAIKEIQSFNPDRQFWTPRQLDYEARWLLDPFRT